jgi:phospholipase C
MPLSRRQFLGAAGVAAAAGVGAGVPAALASSPRGAMPSPSSSGIDHIVFVMMENRSFDHYLGWLPGADGKQAGLTYRDDFGAAHRTHHLTEYTGCGSNDPDHSYEGGRLQFNGGRLDGFRRGDNDDFALGYYTEADLPFYRQLLPHATTFDRYFASILGPTYPNRFYSHAAYTDRLDNTTRTATVPTIWDRLAAAGVPATYYFSDVPFLALWGEQYLKTSKPYASFLAQAASGTLPAFSYVDPSFLGEDQGGSNDDHPHADIRRGQAFLYDIVTALMAGPQWSRTALVISYDEWGGFFDHVRPPVLPDDHNGAAGGPDDHTQAGFRVPTFLVSPYARPGAVAHGTYDHTSVLKMVEWRFGLAPLTKRDRAARNLAEVLDFRHPKRVAPTFTPVLDPGPHACVPPVGTNPMGQEDPFWRELATMAARSGWSSRG